MKHTKRWIAAGAIVLVAAGAGTGIAMASGGDDDASDRPITGPALAQASEVAVAEVGGGEVAATEIHDEEGYYEVEVKRPDGSHVDVHLDRNFRVIDSSADSDKGDDQ